MRWLILSICCIIQALCTIALLSWGPLSPFLVTSFNITNTQLGLFMTVGYLASLLFSLPAGWLTDRVGIRLLLSISPGAMGVCYIVFSRLDTLSYAYVVVFFMGLSYVLINPATVKALRLWFPTNMRGTAISIKQGGVTLGGAAGAVILPILSSRFGWRTGVVIVGLILMFGTIIGYVFYRDPPRIIAPVKVEPLQFRQLWSVVNNRDLLLLSLLGAGFTAIQQAISTHLVIYLVRVRFFSAIEAGTCLLIVNVAGTLGRITWGVISDRLFQGQREPVLIMIGIIIGLLSLTIGFLGAMMPEWLFFVVVFSLGFTTHGWNGIYFTAVSEMTDDRVIGSGIGWSLTIVYLGILVGPPLFGFIVDVTLSYTLAWLTFGIACGTCVLLLVPIRKKDITVLRNS